MLLQYFHDQGFAVRDRCLRDRTYIWIADVCQNLYVDKPTFRKNPAFRKALLGRESGNGSDRNRIIW